MELSDIAQKLWKRYDLPWQNDAHQADEWYAKSFVRGVINPRRKLEFVRDQGRNFVTSLKYLECGYGANGGFGGISAHYAPRAAGTGLYFEVTPAVYRDFAERLRQSGQAGMSLADIKRPLETEGIIVAGLVATSLEIIEPFFVSFIDALPVSDRKQQGK